MAEGRAALVLTGGGARAAYQVGALLAIRDVWGSKRAENPFPIVCGTSAGAVNAVALAVFFGQFRRGGAQARLHLAQLAGRPCPYRADTLAIAESVLRWGSAVFFGWLVKPVAPLAARQCAAGRVA